MGPKGLGYYDDVSEGGTVLSKPEAEVRGPDADTMDKYIAAKDAQR